MNFYKLTTKSLAAGVVLSFISQAAWAQSTPVSEIWRLQSGCESKFDFAGGQSFYSFVMFDAQDAERVSEAARALGIPNAEKAARISITIPADNCVFEKSSDLARPSVTTKCTDYKSNTNEARIGFADSDGKWLPPSEDLKLDGAGFTTSVQLKPASSYCDEDCLVWKGNTAINLWAGYRFAEIKIQGTGPKCSFSLAKTWKDERN